MAFQCAKLRKLNLILGFLAGDRIGPEIAACRTLAVKGQHGAGLVHREGGREEREGHDETPRRREGSSKMMEHVKGKNR